MASALTRFGVSVSILAAATVLLADQRQLREHTVLVSVMAGDTSVTDMKAGEFTVLEDGITREVLRVAPAPPPSHLVLLVDDSQTMQPMVQDLRTALASLLKALGHASPASEISVMTFGERPTERSPFSPNVTSAERAAGRIFAMPGSGSYFLDALLDTAKDLRKRKAASPVIVAFVDESGPEFSNTLATQISDALRAAGASLWTIAHQAGPQPVNDLPGRERSKVLGDSTTASGGMNVAVLSGQGLTPAFDQVAAAIKARYQVTYGRPESLIPPHTLEVGSTRRDVRVRAPRWAGQ